MAGKLTSQMYDSLVQRLERMADGIASHKGEKNFPAVLDDANRQAMRTGLEGLRQKYETLAHQATQAYDAYDDAYKAAEKQLAKDDDSVRGFYGKTAPLVADFGTKVISPTRARKAKEQAKPKA